MHIRIALSVLFLVMLITGLTLAAPGDFDPSFSPPPPAASTHAALVEPNGHIIAAGENIIRYQPDGTIVTVFGGDTPASGYFAALVRQPDGKVIAGGGANVGEGYVLRFLNNGQPDPEFVSVQTGGNVTSVALLPDGRILAGGFFYNVATGKHNLIMIRRDGAVDYGFSGDVEPSGVVLAVAAQVDGRVLVGGSFGTVNDEPRTGIARLLGDGTLDPDFLPNIAAPLGVYAFALQPDGRILAGAEQLTDGTTSRARIARLLADGSIDSSFVSPDSDTGRAETIAIQPWNEQILAGGSFQNSRGIELLMRVNPDGTRDPTFVSAVGGSEDYIDALAVQFDGKVLVAGGIEAPAPNLVRLDNGTIPSTVLFYQPAYRVAEDGGSAKISVARYGPAIDTATVTYLTRRGTATPFGDYRPSHGVVSFPPAARVRSFEVPVIDDTLLNEGDETVPLVLGRPSDALLGPASEAVLTIIENDID